MKDWNRKTSEKHWDALTAEQKKSLQQFVKTHSLSGLILEALKGIETHSHKPDGVWGEENTRITTLVFISKPWMIWQQDADYSGRRTYAARLDHLTVQDLQTLPHYQAQQENGVLLMGNFHERGGPGRAIIPLGDEPAAQAFKNLVLQWISPAA